MKAHVREVDEERFAKYEERQIRAAVIQFDREQPEEERQRQEEEQPTKKQGLRQRLSPRGFVYGVVANVRHERMRYAVYLTQAADVKGAQPTPAAPSRRMPAAGHPECAPHPCPALPS